MSEPLLPAESLESGSDPSVIVNDNARRLEVIALPALSFEATEPGSPADGDIFVLSAAWGEGVEHDLAYYFDGAWSFWTPFEGQIKDVGGDSYRVESGAWEPYSPGLSASIAIQYVADTGSTADSDPGAGLLKWNNATQASATQLYLDDLTDDGVSLTGLWAALDAGGFVYLQHALDPDTWQIWEVTAVTDATGYAKLTVALLANGDDFADADPMLVTIEQGAGVIGRLNVSALATSGSVAVDYALGDYFTLALAGNVSGFTFSNLPGAGKGATLMIQITQDSTPRTVAWPASFKWAGGVAGVVSTGSGAVDVLAITTFDNGTTWRATLAKAFA